jgi:hypothetical protein
MYYKLTKLICLTKPIKRLYLSNEGFQILTIFREGKPNWLQSDGVYGADCSYKNLFANVSYEDKNNRNSPSFLAHIFMRVSHCLFCKAEGIECFGWHRVYN